MTKRVICRSCGQSHRETPKPGPPVRSRVACHSTSRIQACVRVGRLTSLGPPIGARPAGPESGAAARADHRTCQKVRAGWLSLMSWRIGRRMANPFVNILDECTRECLAAHVARRIRSQDVTLLLADLFLTHGWPTHIRIDNGPGFMAQQRRSWLTHIGITPRYIELGSPWRMVMANRSTGSGSIR